MEIYDNAWTRTDLPSGTVGTVGNFDGVHRGQRSVIELAVSRAREEGVPAVVVTFEPHPLRVLDPARAPQHLTTPNQKADRLEALGVDALVNIAFTPQFSRTPARRFVRELLHERLGMREIYVGAGFTFGHRREGDLSLLRAMGGDFGFRAFGVEPVTHAGAPISSTRIRSALTLGEVAQAAEMLGRPYAMSGIVVRGAQRGRTLGWPTINLASDNELIPADGVYVARVRLADAERWLASVVNIGKRPTFEDEMTRVIEGHILDFDGDLYGTRATIGLLRRLRGERVFSGVDDLKRQIALDAQAAREYFRAPDCYPVAGKT
jgi:riboflavin kinase/FMN adenylyltransferase